MVEVFGSEALETEQLQAWNARECSSDTVYRH